MPDVVNLGTRISNLDVSPQFDTYSKVIIHIDDDNYVQAGNDTGRTLEIDNPLGTQELASEILNKLRGFQYQPYQADGSLLDPAAEIGDAVNTPSVYGGIYTRSRTFGRLMKTDISAPHDEEINHEYQFESPQERKYTREMGDVRASLLIQSNMIQAEVVARQNADNEMSSRITQTANAITAEVVARQTDVNGLRTETNTKFTQTNAMISAEVAARETAVSGLRTETNSKFTQTNNAISAEVSARQTAINGLTSTMNTKFTQTNSAITAEVNRATQAEGNLSASLNIQASEIAAKVDSSGGGGSFSWVLNSSSHTWKANNTEVMKVSASGLWLKGQIEASSGKIGGFDIGSNALTYNGLNYGDADKNYGCYIGQSGLQLGKNFRVDNAGNVSANNMSLQGTLMIGGSYITADDLRLGAARANSGYNGWNNAYDWTSNNGGYCTSGAYYGYNYNNATQNGTNSYPSYFTCGYLYARSGLNVTGSCNASSMSAANGITVGGYYTATWQRKTVKGSDGNNVTIYYLGR